MDTRTTESLLEVKTDILRCQGIAESACEALSLLEVTNKELYAEVGVWLVEFSTRIGDLMVMRSVLETSGSNVVTEEGVDLIRAAIMATKPRYDELMLQVKDVVQDKYGWINARWEQSDEPGN